MKTPCIDTPSSPVFLTAAYANILRAAAVMALAFAAPLQLQAQTTYSGATGNWGDAANWTPSGVPNGIGVSITRTLTTTATLTQNVTGGVTLGSISASATSLIWTFNPTEGITFNQDGAGAGAASITENGSGNGRLVFGSGTLTLADDLNISNIGTSTNSAGSISFSSVIGGTGNLKISNASNDAFSGQIDFVSANTFTGNVTIAKGAVSIKNSASFGSSSNTITLGSSGGGDATLMARTISGTSGNWSAGIANNIVVAAGAGGTLKIGAAYGSTSGTSNATYGAGFTGTVLLNDNVTLYSAVTGTNALSFTNVISGTGGLAVTSYAANSNTRLTGANTFTGDTRIVSGNLQLGAASGNTTLALQNSTVDLNALDAGAIAFGTSTSTTINAATFGGLKGSRDLALVNMNTTPTAVALSVGKNNSTTTYSGKLTGSGSLIKTGTGTLTLSGSSSYTGATTVSAGTLGIAAGGNINSSAVTVAAGARFAYNSSTARTGAITLNGNGASNHATLSGTGAIGVGITLDNIGDTLSPGNSPGVMNFTTSQAWNSFTYVWETNNFTGTSAGTDFDQIAISGGLTLSGSAFILDLQSLTALNVVGNVENFSEMNRSWTILTTTSGITGFNSEDWTIVTSNFESASPWQGTWNLTESDGSLVLRYAVVPEPSTWALAASSLVIMTIMYRRRK